MYKKLNALLFSADAGKCRPCTKGFKGVYMAKTASINRVIRKTQIPEQFPA
jgi:hypothetical protein